MMRLTRLISMIILLLIAGCGPEPARLAQHEPIQGAYGFKLGEKLPDVPEVKKENGEYTLSREGNFGPFDTVIVTATADREIYDISFFVLRWDLMKMRQRELLNELESKYGLKRRSKNSDRDESIFGLTGTNEVKLSFNKDNTAWLIYQNPDLSMKSWKAQEQQRKSEAKKF